MSTLINNFEPLQNADNAGGAPWFQVVLPADIDTIPDRILDQIGSAITLNSGAVAYNIKATTGTVQWNETPQLVDGRQQYVSVFSFVIPKDRADVLNYAQHLNNRGVVAIVRDANGQSRLMGTKEEPATFRLATRTLGTPQNGRNEHRYEIVLTSAKPVPFYEVTAHLPAPANVCAAATVQLNGSTVGSIASGLTDSFDVLQSGSAVGSWNGSAWIIPALSCTISTTTPDLGTAYTLTATAVGMTPTSYTFYLPRVNGTYHVVTQASNTYVWTAEGNGTEYVVVTATDGSTTMSTELELDVQFPFVADDYAGMSTAIGMFKASSSYTGDCFQVQRSSDGAYLEVGFVNGCVADLESLKAWAGIDEVKITTWYDTTGNGNHLKQTVAANQVPISNYGGIQLDDGGVILRDNTKLDMTTGGTNSPIGAAVFDIYSTISVNAFVNGIYALFSRRTNSGFMLLGQSGSTAHFASNFGSGTYYFNGSAAGWANRGDVYTALYQTGRNQISILGASTTSADWSTNFRTGELDFGTYVEGASCMHWMWTTSTAANRTAIEAAQNALMDLIVD